MAEETSLRQMVAGFSNGIIGRGKSTGMCFMVCVALQGYLEFAGYPCRLIKGEIDGEVEHYWLELPDGKIIDPTTDQFNYRFKNKRLSRPYIGARPRWYKIIKEGRK